MWPALESDELPTALRGPAFILYCYSQIIMFSGYFAGWSNENMSILFFFFYLCKYL